jgi:hypothetical protein
MIDSCREESDGSRAWSQPAGAQPLRGIFGTGLALALTVPGFLFAATISSCSTRAGVMATIALSPGRLFAAHLSRWDVAAAPMRQPLRRPLRRLEAIRFNPHAPRERLR